MTSSNSVENAPEPTERSAQAEHPSVAVIIPCWNAEKWVARAIQSVLDQDYPNLEVIVIDDGSTDNSLDVIRSFGDRIRWETGPNRGPCAARNKGFALAKGEWIQFLDADDMLHPNKIAYSIELAGRYPNIDFVWAPHKQINKHFTSINVRQQRLPGTIIAGPGFRVLDARYAPWAALFRRRFLEKVGPWTEELRRWVDLEYHARIAAERPIFLVLQTPLYYYRRHGEGQISTQRFGKLQLDQAYAALLRTRQVLEESSLFNEWRHTMFQFYFFLALRAATINDRGNFGHLLKEAVMLRDNSRNPLLYTMAMLGASMVGARPVGRAIEFGIKCKAIARRLPLQWQRPFIKVDEVSRRKY
ncbi:MAG: glycosyltransferase [Hyphomicrobiaceae bacterium]|nr:glycosyltransferase [Hyphomicrobiaceae bacterium]